MANKYTFCISFIVGLILFNCVTVVKSISDDYDYDYDDDKKLKWLSPWEVQELPPEPRPNYYKDLRSCLKTLTWRCNNRLYNVVFAKQVIHKPCCKQLYHMELGCLESLAWVLTQGNSLYKAKHVDQRFKDALNVCSDFKQWWLTIIF